MNQPSFLLSILVLLFSPAIFGQDFDIYVSDAGNFDKPPWQILKFDGNGENPEVFTKENLAWPQDILFLEDQQVVLISNLNSGLIAKHDASTGAYLENFASGIGGPTRMKIGPDSLLYVLQWTGNGRVFRYELDGTFVDQFTNTGVPQSIGIDWDADGNLYVSSYTGDFVRKFDPSGNNLGLFINNNLMGPTNICFTDNGDLLVLDYDGGAIRLFDKDGQFIENFATGLNNPEGIAFLPNNNILIGNGGTSAVRSFTPTGAFIKDFIASGAGDLLTPNAVIVRHKTAVSAGQVVSKSYKVIPSAGSTFFFEAPDAHMTAIVEVYNTSGVLVHRGKTYGGSPLWDAHGFENGLYYLVVRLDKEGILGQKVLVYHQ